MNRQYFPGKEISSAEGAVQIVASGPSSDDKSIRNTLLAIMGSAKNLFGLLHHILFQIKKL